MVQKWLDKLWHDINDGKFGEDAKTATWFLAIKQVKDDNPKGIIMATYRLLHVTRTGGEYDGLAEFTNADSVLMPVHTSDPSATTEGEMIYNSTDNTIKVYDGSAWISLAKHN